MSRDLREVRVIGCEVHVQFVRRYQSLPGRVWQHGVLVWWAVPAPRKGRGEHPVERVLPVADAEPRCTWGIPTRHDRSFRSAQCRTLGRLRQLRVPADVGGASGRSGRILAWLSARMSRAHRVGDTAPSRARHRGASSGERPAARCANPYRTAKGRCA